MSAFRGREMLYPQRYGDITAGADKNYPLDYSHLNIQGYAAGAKGLPEGIEANPDTATFPSVSTETEYGWNSKVKIKLPIFTGALGSTEIARKNWEHFAIGAAISGITLVCGENVCGVDPELELNRNGKIANFEQDLIWLWADVELNPSPDVQELVKEVEESFESEFSDFVGMADFHYKCPGYDSIENALGNWIADVMRARFCVACWDA